MVIELRDSLPKMPPLLVFDLMDTVVVDPFYREAMAYLGTTLADLGKVKHPTSWIEFETGIADEASFLERFYRAETALTLADPLAFRQVFFDAWRFVPGMEELLGELKAAGHPLWVLSNYSPWAVELRRRLDLDRFFAGYCFSYEIGCRKPDPAAYRALVQKSGSAHCLVIDDRPANVEGAQRAGLEGLLFIDAPQLRRTLRNRKLL